MCLKYYVSSNICYSLSFWVLADFFWFIVPLPEIKNMFLHRYLKIFWGGGGSTRSLDKIIKISFKIPVLENYPYEKYQLYQRKILTLFYIELVR
jgi:hypothetical protein